MHPTSSMGISFSTEPLTEDSTTPIPLGNQRALYGGGGSTYGTIYRVRCKFRRHGDILRSATPATDAVTRPK